MSTTLTAWWKVKTTKSTVTPYKFTPIWHGPYSEESPSSTTASKRIIHLQLFRFICFKDIIQKLPVLLISTA